jgi:hypothetical protein
MYDTLSTIDWQIRRSIGFEDNRVFQITHRVVMLLWII